MAPPRSSARSPARPSPTACSTMRYSPCRRRSRTGEAQWLAEAVATFGLVTTILVGIRMSQRAVPVLVGLYITAAYWFTASTSFANPAVSIARSLTDTFSGIRAARPSRLHYRPSRRRTRRPCARVVAPEPRTSNRRHGSGGSALTVTIFHNPDCGTSRNTLALIRRAGIEPTVIEYLKTTPDRDTLKDLFGRAGLSAAMRLGKRDALRGTWSCRSCRRDEAILDAMMACPILINRPIVMSARASSSADHRTSSSTSCRPCRRRTFPKTMANRSSPTARSTQAMPACARLLKQPLCRSTTCAILGDASSPMRRLTGHRSATADMSHSGPKPSSLGRGTARPSRQRHRAHYPGDPSAPSL